ncbi:MAG: pyrroline-5-carboxylate reductase [Lachnospiraceae bacterium]|nr:pyrroline-5-carboxylate reductase [Lachnospiraceae bacterium]
MKIGFIGLGNMAKAMIGGMLSKGIAKPEDIQGSARTEGTCKAVKETYGIEVFKDNGAVASWADMLILAVKPQMFGEVIPEIKNKVKDDTIVISIAAGKTLAQIEETFGRSLKLVRCMPNTPAMVGEGCSGVCRNERVTDEEMESCMGLIESFGIAEEVPEKLMDAVVGVSGSSPAFVFMFLEAMADGAVKAGMPRGQAYRFAAQTVLGCAKLMQETGKHPGELKDMVCSPAGTTICGVQVLEDMGFRSTVMNAVDACAEKSRNM